MRTRISAFLLALCATMPAISAGPNDPRAVDLWSMYSRDGNCLEIPRCIDGYITRVHKREWMPLYLSDVGVPSNAERIFVVGMLNVTHPAADTSTAARPGYNERASTRAARRPSAASTVGMPHSRSSRGVGTTRSDDGESLRLRASSATASSALSASMVKTRSSALSTT